MKVALITMALVSVALSELKKKRFHEHFDDFVTLIHDAAGDQMAQLSSQYLEFDEFQNTLEYLETADFKKLVYEMECLPEFIKLVDFLENHNIDITYFIKTFNNLLENVPRVKKMHQRSVVASGKDLNSFVKDCTQLFPRKKLATLFNYKMERDKEFHSAVEGLKTQEFEDIVEALQDNQVFTAEVQIFAENGIEIPVLLDQLLAVFGQN